MTIPKKYKAGEIETRWQDHWSERGVYDWKPDVPRENTFTVDTPPPTVSGSLHVGHVFSYTQTDLIVRYQRMQGKNIFYPMGWDDNGLPTERRVQNVYGISCNPRLPYEKDWKPEPQSGKKSKKSDAVEVSRKNFIEACEILTGDDEKAFEALWRRLGLSVDWSLQYATIDDHCRKLSQYSFLDLVEKGFAYSHEAPTMWDIDFRTAVAQAELEDREMPGAYHDIKFAVEGGGDFTISTTRPELLAACIAVVAHPDDKRFKDLFGKHAITPLFHAKVPILPAEHADPEKGTGILMVCTFGDVMDVEWWKSSKLPAKQIIGRDGRLIELDYGTAPFTSENPELANSNYGELSGLTIKQAQKKIVELLAADGSAVDGNGTALLGEPKQIMHPVKFFEKGDRPVEFLTTRQWFVKVCDYKEELLAQGRKISWHPEYMRARYEHWVEGLNTDWCISRQRFFGVSFPVWYPLGENGEPNYDSPIYAKAESLPVDPMSDVPEGYTEDQRGQAGGFIGDPDVMDTWATSALTPQIASGWYTNSERHAGLYPMDLRPQAHDIIRTWAFVTILKSWMHEGTIPWSHIALSGWILDPDRKKMSKSKGNVVTPDHLLTEYSSDGVRYWAARARLGTDTAFDDKVFKIGQKLVLKIFNMGKFVVSLLSQLEGEPVSKADISEPLDLAQIEELRATIAKATKSFEAFDYATALQAAEDSFWKTCDFYLELVKTRAYKGEDLAARRSALATLKESLLVYLRLFAPALPFITEEVWSWHPHSTCESIHHAPWPKLEELQIVATPEQDNILLAASEVLSEVRKQKSVAQTSLTTEVTQLKVKGVSSKLSALKSALSDLIHAGHITESGMEFEEDGDLQESDPCEVQVTLAESSS